MSRERENSTYSKILFLILSFLIISAPHASSSSSDQIELLKYEVTWNGSRAGHGDITTKADSNKVSVTAQAVSDGPLKALVEIWSRIQATFSAKTIQPETYRFHLRSNLLRSEVVDLSFDHRTKSVTVNKQKGDEQECHTEKVMGLYDPISAVFLLRKQKDLAKPMFVDIFDGKDKARLYVTPQGQEQISIKSGQHEALRLNLRLVKLTSDQKEIATGKLWISNDSRKIPLLLTSSPIVGTIRFELIHAQL
ncbi:MAG: DUF3108 domain-containing protein [Desulfomonilaceae bacterium]